MNTCPVCGYDALELPYTEDGNICPSCGTEFGYDDLLNSREDLRRHWIQVGAEWWDATLPQPLDWSVDQAVRQLRNVGYQLTSAERRAVEVARLNRGRIAGLSPIVEYPVEVTQRD